MSLPSFEPNKGKALPLRRPTEHNKRFHVVGSQGSSCQEVAIDPVIRVTCTRMSRTPCCMSSQQATRFSSDAIMTIILLFQELSSTFTMSEKVASYFFMEEKFNGLTALAIVSGAMWVQWSQCEGAHVLCDPMSHVPSQYDTEVWYCRY